MTLSIVQRNNVKIALAATTSAVTSEPYELVSDKSYTIFCTNLAGAETIELEVYDHSTEQFQPLRSSGAVVSLKLNYELLTFNNAMVIRFVKSVTSNPVGVNIIHR